MTRESKLAMMIAVTLILLVGVLLSDHLSGARTAEFDEPVQRAPVAGPLANLPGASEPLPLPIIPPPLITQAEQNQAIDGIIIPQDSRPVEINQGFSVATNAADMVERAWGGIEGAISGTRWPEAPVMIATGGQSQAAPSQPAPAQITTTFGGMFVPAPPETVTIGGSPVRIGTPVRTIPEPQTRPAPPRPAPSFRTHTVQEGDSLYRLAARYLGDGNKWRQLQKLNADQLGESENVQVGMVIKIAPAESAPAARNAPARSQPATTSRPAPTREYVVLRGDNLGKISLKLLGTSKRMSEIVKLNNLRDPDDIRVGQSLRIPPK